MESPAPTHWSQQDKSNMLTLSHHHYKVSYSGPGKSDADAGSVRSNFPVSGSFFYYEITVLNKGRDGYIAIGYCLQSVSLGRLPGWEIGSFAYHGDDGCVFNQSGRGKPFGPTFTQGDVIGCGLNRFTNTIFYTKNGLYLGVAFSQLPSEPLFCTVGLRTSGEQVDSNFGKRPFVYDIRQHIKDEQLSFTRSVDSISMPDTQIELLILKHLIREAMPQSARGLAIQLGVLPQFEQQILEAQRRRQIMDLILSGQIDQAIAMLNGTNNAKVLFQLKCRKFIEMIHQTSMCRDEQQQNVMLHEALSFGQTLQDQFRGMENAEQLFTETFSVLAYADPMNSEARHLFEERPKLAQVVNDALSVEESPLLVVDQHLQSLIMQVNPCEQSWLSGVVGLLKQ